MMKMSNKSEITIFFAPTRNGSKCPDLGLLDSIETLPFMASVEMERPKKDTSLPFNIESRIGGRALTGTGYVDSGESGVEAGCIRRCKEKDEERERLALKSGIVSFSEQSSLDM